MLSPAYDCPTQPRAHTREKNSAGLFPRAAPAMALVSPAAAVGVGKTDVQPRQGGPFEERTEGKV